MELGESYQQKHSPCETKPEIRAATASIAHLYEKTETEEQGECGVRFSCKKEIQEFRGLRIKHLQPFRPRSVPVENVIMLKAVK